MKIKVYPPPFVKGGILDDDNQLALQDGATLEQVYRLLKIPTIFKPIINCQVNYQKASLNQVLKDGDVVSFIVFITGG